MKPEAVVILARVARVLALREATATPVSN